MQNANGPTNSRKRPLLLLFLCFGLPAGWARRRRTQKIPHSLLRTLVFSLVFHFHVFSLILFSHLQPTGRCWWEYHRWCGKLARLPLLLLDWSELPSLQWRPTWRQCVTSTLASWQNTQNKGLKSSRLSVQRCDYRLRNCELALQERKSKTNNWSLVVSCGEEK